MADETEENGSIFPIINRQTPVIDRIKQRRSGGEEDTSEEENELASTLGEEVGNAIISDDESKNRDDRLVAMNSFRDSLATTLGVDPSQIRDTFVRQVGDMFGGLEESDVLTEDARRQLGLSGGSKEESSEKEEGEEDSFLDE